MVPDNLSERQSVRTVAAGHPRHLRMLTWKCGELEGGGCVMEEGTVNTNLVTRGRLEHQCEQRKTQPVEGRKKLMDSGSAGTIIAMKVTP